MEPVAQFYFILFNNDEKVCWSKDCYGTSLTPVWESVKDTDRFFSINPLHTSRADAHVTCFRNILLEFDSITPDQQLQLLDYIPHSTLVWSGGKSYHAIISLEEPCEDRVEYDALVKRIYEKVPSADKSTKNPSRFSRAPEAIRENGNTQSLIHIYPRVLRAEIEAWLGPETIATKTPKNVSISRDHKRILMPATSYFLFAGAQPGYWNSMLFSAVCDMVRAGYDKDEITEKARAITGKLDKTDLRTIQSAWDTVHRDANG